VLYKKVMGFGLLKKSLKGATKNPSKLNLNGKNSNGKQSDILKPYKLSI
jgi:hypothetical protein